MWTRRILLALVFALAALLSAARVLAQGAAPDFPTVRRLYTAHEPARAAYALNVASVYVRQQLGRSHDDAVGTRLMAAESRLDQLAAGLRARAVDSAATLDSAFAQTDRLLVEHHWRLASWELGAKDVARATVGEDLGAAAHFLARSFTFTGRAPDDATAQAIAEARRVADAIATTNALPRDTRDVLETLGRRIVPPATMAVR